MVVQSTGFSGTQTGVPQQESKKKTYALPGAVVGGAIGGLGTRYLSYGQKPQFETVDSFVASPDAKQALEKVTEEDKKPHVETLKTALDKRAKASTDIEEQLKTIFGDSQEVEISKVLSEQKLEASKNIVKPEAAEALEKMKKELEALEPNEANKSARSTLQTQITVRQKAKALAEALGITAETTPDAKISKETVQKAFAENAETLDKNAASAFDNIKNALPKVRNNGNIAIGAAIGAAVAGIIGYMMKKNDN